MDIHYQCQFRFYISNAKLQKQTHGCTKIVYLHVYRMLIKTVIVTLGPNYLQLFFNSKQRTKFHVVLNPVSLRTAPLQCPPMCTQPCPASGLANMRPVTSDC